MNWSHTNFVGGILSACLGLWGCQVKPSEATPDVYELNVIWADGTPCADAEVQWLGQGDWTGSWGAGFEEIPLSFWMQTDALGHCQWQPLPESPILHAIRIRLRSDTTITQKWPVSNPLAATLEAEMPKPIAVTFLPGRNLPESLTQVPVWVSEDAAGWSLLGEVHWTRDAPPIIFLTDAPRLSCWINMAVGGAPLAEQQWQWHQRDLPQTGGWPDSLVWRINLD